jgi:pyridoxamine 5'-phosphate oxidase
MNMEQDISKMRTDYKGDLLDERQVDKDPFKQFDKWFTEAVNKKVMEPNAMSLASVDANGAPSLRIVLLKDYSNKGLTFFSNYTSKKGKDLENNPHASILFFWPELSRQVRIDGVVSKVDPGISEKYFKERPKESQIAAWISQQSTEVKNKAELDQKFSEFSKAHSDKEIPYPVFWGGYILKPNKFEFWQGQMVRLHDRVQYTLNSDTDEWRIARLAP